MADVTANVVVSMPAQLFTAARSFKAVANGRIYIGKIDTDPTIPENQIQVYIENEDNSLVPIEQPIIINAAGFPVYGGQITKFVTVAGHSMAVMSAYGALEHYYPNVLNYDPDQYQKSLDKVKFWVTLKEYGAVGDGVTDDTKAIIKAFADAAEKNLKVIQNDGVFRVTGTDDIVIKGDADLTGSIIRPDAAWASQIRITQKESMVVYDNTSGIVNSINASSSNSRTVGSNVLDGLASETALNGCYVQIATSQPMYIFRDTTYTRLDLNRVYNRGNLENPLKYGLGTNVQTIKSLKIRDIPQTISGLTIDESLTRRYRIIFINAATRVKLVGTSFINRPVTQTFSDTRIEAQDCYDLEFDGTYTPSVADSFNATGDIYSYTIGLGTCMNVRHKNVTANGEGWGSTGNNNCANILYEDCDLSRIDFHMPFQGYLKVRNCNIGRWGILATGIGDLIVENTTFNASIDMNSNIIATRADAGGYFDGDLYMSNITLAGRRSDSYPGVAFINASSTSGQGPAPGSPISPTLFNKIVIRDVKLKEGSIQSTFGTFISANRDNTLLFPSVIDISGFDFATLPKSAGLGLNIDFSRFKALYPDMNNSENPISGRVTTDIILCNIKSPQISITSASFRHNPRVVIENARHVLPNDGNCTLIVNQRGSYDINSCKVDQIRLVSGVEANGSVNLRMNGGRIVNSSSSSSPIVTTSDSHYINLNSTVLNLAFNSQDSNYSITRNLMRFTVMNSCEFYDYNSGSKLSLLQYATVAGTAITTTIPLRCGQEFAVASGYNSNSTYTKTFFRGSDSSSSRQVAAIGAGNIIITPTVTGNLVTNMVITSPTGNEVVGLFVK